MPETYQQVEHERDKFRSDVRRLLEELAPLRRDYAILEDRCRRQTQEISRLREREADLKILQEYRERETRRADGNGAYANAEVRRNTKLQEELKIATELLREIYKWTAYKETDWSKRAKAFLWPEEVE